MNHKRTYRIYREEGPQVRTNRRRRLTRPRVPTLVPDKANQRWSMDFVSDQLANSQWFRVLNVGDEYSQECLLQIADFSISGHRVPRELERLSRALPKTILWDNGPEFPSKAMFLWAKKAGVKLNFIQPGKPTQNACVESFNGKFRDYHLDLNWFASLEDALSTIDTWRDHYNLVRTPLARQEAARRIRPGNGVICSISHIIRGSGSGARSSPASCGGTVWTCTGSLASIASGQPRLWKWLADS